MVVCPKCKKEMTLLVKPRKRYYICCEEYTEEFMEMYMRVYAKQLGSKSILYIQNCLKHSWAALAQHKRKENNHV